MKVDWKPEFDLKLCVTIIELAEAKTPKWLDVSTVMEKAIGQQVSREAAR